MDVALQQPWTVEKFFAWAERQEGRYEFDGEQPVAMTGGSNRHAIIMRSLHRADPWTALPLSAGDRLKLPELGIEMPVDELHDGLEFMEVQTAS
jgi:hypothetical protein